MAFQRGRRRRLRSAIEVATTLLAARAIAIEDGDEMQLDESDFVANLIEMCTALLQAPWGERS